MLSPQFSWPCSTLLPTLRPLTYRCGAKMCKILKPLLNEAFSSQLNYLNIYLIYIWLLMGWRCNHFWLNPLYLRGLWYVTRARLEECMVLRVRLPVSPRCNFKIPQEKRWKKQPSNVTRHKKEYYQPSWLSKSENLYLLQFEIGSKVLPTLDSIITQVCLYWQKSLWGLQIQLFKFKDKSMYCIHSLEKYSAFFLISIVPFSSNGLISQKHFCTSADSVSIILCYFHVYPICEQTTAKTLRWENSSEMCLKECPVILVHLV